MKYPLVMGSDGVDAKEEFFIVFKQLHESSVLKSLQSKYGESAFDIMLLIGALILFTRNDAALLFNEKKDVDERSMAGCVYRYMYCACLMDVFESTQPDIDIEYDRMRVVGKDFVPKYFTICARPEKRCEEHQYEACKCFIKDHAKTCGKCKQFEKRIRPDLIIHRRDSEPGSDNGLIVEFKRHKVDGCDDVKLVYSTCSHGTLKYEVGAKVTLSCASQLVELYRDSIKMDELNVFQDHVDYNV